MKSASRVALFAAAGLFVGGVAMPSAKAADLGGDCCADLEERVAELEATTARKGNRRVSLTVSGQVNRAMMFWDDGRHRDMYSVDNAVSRSGFQFDGTAKVNPNLTAGFQFVIGLNSGARSHNVTQFDDDGNSATQVSATVDGDVGMAVELANWFLRHDTIGELRVGRINSAQAGTTVVDLGGAGVIANAQFGLAQSAMFLPSENGLPTTYSTMRWNDLFGGNSVSISSLSRQHAISYTTPTVGGFSAQVAYGEDNFWDAALRYAGEFSGFRVAAAVSYSKVTDVEPDGAVIIVPITSDIDQRKLQGSASILHVASGLFVSGSYVNLSFHGSGTADICDALSSCAGSNRPDVTMWYLLGGISKNWTGLGNTVVYGEYGNVQDGAAGRNFGTGFDIINTSDATMWGVGVVQNIDAAAMELYLAYKRFTGEMTGLPAGDFGNTSVEDFSMVMGGARIKF